MKNLIEWLGVLIEVALVAFLVRAFPPFTPEDEFRLAPVLVLAPMLLAMVYLVHGRDLRRR